MATPPSHVDQLELVLLRRGVGALQAEQSRCADCGRTPLTGEQVHFFAGPHARGERLVCELCRPNRREPPLASEIVRSAGHGHSVRLTARAA